LASLARLRLRSAEEAETDVLLQLELKEMRVEAQLIQHHQSLTAGAKTGIMYTEARAWGRLFEREYIDRTLIGVLMMVFQRWFPLLFSFVCGNDGAEC